MQSLVTFKIIDETWRYKTIESKFKNLSPSLFAVTALFNHFVGESFVGESFVGGSFVCGSLVGGSFVAGSFVIASFIGGSLVDGSFVDGRKTKPLNDALQLSLLIVVQAGLFPRRCFFLFNSGLAS